MLISKKNTIASAALILCSMSTLAQAQTNVVVYGKLFPQINRYSLSGATPTTLPVSQRSTLTSTPTGAADISGLAMESSNSKLGVRGTEDLGNGMKATFQLLMQLEVSDGTVSSNLWSQDTYVGLTGGFGSVKFGRLDTVYKQIGDTMSFLGISSGNFVSGSNVLSKQGFGTSNTHRFHERFNNQIYYESPEIGGFQGAISYSLGEIPGDVRKSSAVSLGVTYTAGQVYLALAHEQHNDFFGASRNVPTAISNTTIGTNNNRGTPAPGMRSTDTASRATAQYKFTPSTRAEVNFAHMVLKETGGAAGRFQNYEHNTWSVGAQHKMAQLTFQGLYGVSGEGSCSLVGSVACSTSGIKANMLSLGTSYALSKRTNLFMIYTKMNNDVNAAFANGDQRPALGQDTAQFAIGIDHNF